MIVGSAPLRVSLLGGGSDVPSFFVDHVGAVLGGSINLRVYVCVIKMVEFADYPFRFTYRQVDNANVKSEIKHPVWRTLLESRPEIKRINAATFSDIPGNSGLGSSSSFTVAAIAALNGYLGIEWGNERISNEAIRVERVELAESGGWQDQLHATYGGFRLYTLSGENVTIGEELLTTEERRLLNKSSILVKIGQGRKSSEFHSSADVQISKTRGSDLDSQAKLAIHGAEILSAEREWSSKLDSICELMLENWQIKKSFFARSATGVDELIAFGLNNGAKSAKLCGAGGSGFILFIGEPDGVKKLREKIDSKLVIDFEFDCTGVKSTNV